MKTKILIIGLLALICAGCMTPGQRAAMDSWIGHSQDEVMARWGAPTRVVQTGNGSILVYEEAPGMISNTIQPTRYNGQPLYNYPATTTTTVIEHNTQFFVNASGIVYSWRRQ